MGQDSPDDGRPSRQSLDNPQDLVFPVSVSTGEAEKLLATGYNLTETWRIPRDGDPTPSPKLQEAFIS
jgi:hypothetical protein